MFTVILTRKPLGSNMLFDHMLVHNALASRMLIDQLTPHVPNVNEEETFILLG
jgi:hypothetical protein